MPLPRIARLPTLLLPAPSFPAGAAGPAREPAGDPGSDGF
jgi:hypothetical protein